MSGILASRLLIALLCLISAARLFIIVAHQLPAPIWDSAFFLGPAFSYCQSGFLGSVIYAVDSFGTDRLVWHGFLSPLLYGVFSFGCSIESFFVVHALVVLICTGLAYHLSKLSGFDEFISALFGFYVFCVVAQLQFRPEPVALIFVLASEIAFAKRKWPFAGAASGLLLVTQPALFGLYGLYLLVARDVFSARVLAAGSVGLGVSLIGAFAIYPFPVWDWLTGIVHHQQVLAARTPATSLNSFIGLFVRPSALPFWIIPTFLAFVVFVKGGRLLALPLTFALYWLSFRNFLQYYNLFAISPLLLLFALSQVRSVYFVRSIGALMLVGVSLGLSLSVWRGVESLLRDSDSRATTLSLIEGALTDQRVTLRHVPHFYPFLRPDLQYERNFGFRLKSNSSGLTVAHLSLLEHHVKCSEGKEGFQGIFGFRLFPTPIDWSVCQAELAPETPVQRE